MVTNLGQRLRAAREKRGLSMEDAAHQTRIPVFRLMHLERDNYAAFGSMTYARAFLKLYSRFLNVDASEILTDLPASRLGGRRDYRYLIEEYGRWIPERRDSFADLPAWSFQNRGARSPFATAFGVFVAVLIGAGLWGGHVAGERAQMSQEQAALEAEDAALEIEAGEVVLKQPLAPIQAQTRVREAMALRAIPIDPAAVPTSLQEEMQIINRDPQAAAGRILQRSSDQ